MSEYEDLGPNRASEIMAQGEPVDLPEGLAPAEPTAPQDADEKSTWGGDDAFPGDDLPPPAPPAEGEPDDPARDCAAYPLNDMGNGKRYVCHFGEDVKLVPRIGWHVWNGAIWQHDPDEIEVRRRAQELGGLIEREIPHVVLEDWQMKTLADGQALKRRARELGRALEAGGPAADAARDELARIDGPLSRLRGVEKILNSVRKDHHGWAKTSGNSGRIDAALKEATVSLAIKHDALDASPLDICCQNGVLRFGVDKGNPAEGDFGAGASVELVAHDRGQLMTKQMPVVYDPDARAPKFEAFLRRILPDPEIRGFIQRWFGLSMTGLTGEQKLVFLYGLGANGKSVLVDLIAKILGDYSATAKIETLTGQGKRDGAAPTPDLIPLMRARLVRASEPEEGERFREALIKELTGGEPINVRPNYGEFIAVLPVFKLTIQGNHKPEIRGRDDGIWRRFLLVPFDVTIPASERDPDLGAKLFEERSGILNWLVDGLLAYLEGGLREPAAVMSATQEYREESDPLGHFLESACVVSGQPEDSEFVRDLVQAFQFWQDEQGGAVWQPGTVQRQLKDKMRRWVSPTTGKKFTERKSNGVMRYDGIRFTDVFGPRFRAAPRDSQGRPIAGKTSEGGGFGGY